MATEYGIANLFGKSVRERGNWSTSHIHDSALLLNKTTVESSGSEIQPGNLPEATGMKPPPSEHASHVGPVRYLKYFSFSSLSLYGYSTQRKPNVGPAKSENLWDRAIKFSPRK